MGLLIYDENNYLNKTKQIFYTSWFLNVFQSLINTIFQLRQSVKKYLNKIYVYKKAYFEILFYTLKFHPFGF